MKFKVFGKIIEIKVKKKELYEYGVESKRKKTMEKIEKGLKIMKENNMKYSEYRLRKVSGVSINTIKKYRDFIKKWRIKNNYL